MGWFLLNNDNGSKSKIQEKDVTLKFRKNSENDWNVEVRILVIFIIFFIHE